MSDCINSAQQLYDYINDHIEKKWFFRDEKQKFLPRIALQHATSERSMRLAIVGDRSWILPPEEKVRRLLDRICNSEARKLFTIAFYTYHDPPSFSSPVNIVEALLDAGFTDSDLPLDEDMENHDVLKNKLRPFFQYQQQFCVAYFEKDSAQGLKGLAKPIQLDESTSNLLGEGAFGQVYSCKIHPEQRSFSSGANKNEEFALKVTRQEGRELSFHKETVDLSHPNLTKCLASFTHGAKYHMIYEKANCDVEKFMRQCPTAGSRADLSATDLASQMAGMAAALDVIHNQENSPQISNTDNLGLPIKEAKRSGYLHDIKPDNILLSIYIVDNARRYWFRLSDFSCAKVANLLLSQASGQPRSHVSHNKAGSLTYQAPEQLLNQGTSRPSDVWSLGLVYLEMLVWFVDGFDALEKFREDREQEAGGILDNGFCQKTKNGQYPKAQLREVVVSKLNEMSLRCTGPLHTIAKIIPELLVIEPRKRLTAAQLKERLQCLDTGERPPPDDHHSEATMHPPRYPSPSPSHNSGSDFSAYEDVSVTVTSPSI